MRKLGLFWVCAGIAILGENPVQAANLVTNGSFEGPTGVAPSGWSIGGTASDGYTLCVSGGTPHPPLVE